MEERLPLPPGGGRFERGFAFSTPGAGVTDRAWETRCRPGGQGHPVALDDDAASSGCCRVTAGRSVGAVPRLMALDDDRLTRASQCDEDSGRWRAPPECSGRARRRLGCKSPPLMVFISYLTPVSLFV
uniref:Predicted protein n=1 Tax=Hordeum vulgare subsp. vulgare TaxID=112509 RepID=F2D4D6_HORVV|nr:predicted protein [Hordeum vulgare subsp. vulgare]BAJ98369.1 predicted protein [Hordeum vulgare subsp. vulgare]